MPYIPHTESDVAHMLSVIGVDSVEALFDEIPSHLRAPQDQWEQLPQGLNEMRVRNIMAKRAALDACRLNFIGAGAYEHYIPAAVWDLVSRGEIMTAYTPYQAEASQGTLQIIYEFQSIMAEIMGMDVSNASLYDGATALAEAVLMALRCNKKVKGRRLLIAGALHPHYLQVCESICGLQGVEIHSLAVDPVTGSLTAWPTALSDEPAFAVVIPQPNFYGVLEDVSTLTNWAHEQGALVIAVVNPLAMIALSPPGEWGELGADIAVGEAQPLGIPLSSGGPYCGFITCRKSLVRQMPGRIIGQTEDMDGKRGFSLTLQAREQHIRRSKATSNICTNQGLAMTAVTIYVSLMGELGLSRTAHHCMVNARKLLHKLRDQAGFACLFSGDFFHEFVLVLPVDAERVVQAMAARGIGAGLALGAYDEKHRHHLLMCVTETKSEQDMDVLVSELLHCVKELSPC